jgi:hypothetical protein
VKGEHKKVSDIFLTGLEDTKPTVREHFPVAKQQHSGVNLRKTELD